MTITATTVEHITQIGIFTSATGGTLLYADSVDHELNIGDYIDFNIVISSIN
jgi:hypothetical protein